MNWGFNIEFDNGYEISVKWGGGNYCDNHMHDLQDQFSKRDSCAGWESKTAEIAMFNGNGWLDPETMQVIPDGGTDVKGHVDVAGVLDYMNRLAAL